MRLKNVSDPILYLKMCRAVRYFVLVSIVVICLMFVCPKCSALVGCLYMLYVIIMYLTARVRMYNEILDVVGDILYCGKLKLKLVRDGSLKDYRQICTDVWVCDNMAVIKATGKYLACYKLRQEDSYYG